MLRQLDWALVLRLDASNRFAVTFSIIVGVLDREDFDDNDWRLLSSWPLKAWMTYLMMVFGALALLFNAGGVSLLGDTSWTLVTGNCHFRAAV